MSHKSEGSQKKVPQSQMSQGSNDIKSDESIGMGVGLPPGSQLPLQVEDFRTQLCRMNFISGLPVSASSVFFKDFNAIVMFLFCNTHKKVALNKGQNCGSNAEFYSLPYTAYDEAHSLATIVEICGMSLMPAPDGDALKATNSAAKAVSPPPPLKYQLLRETQVLFLDRTFKRLLLLLPLSDKTSDCCTNHDNIYWRTFEEIINDSKDDIYSGEARQLCIHILSHLQTKADLVTMMFEPFFENVNSEHGWEVNSSEVALLTECNINAELCKSLYEDFHEHLYPSLIMTKTSFTAFLVKYQLVKNVNGMQDKRLQEVWLYISSFLSKRQELFTFRNFLLCIVILDKNCPPNNALRNKAIYEYQVTKNKSATFEKIYCFNLNVPESECLLERACEAKPMTPNKFTEMELSLFFRFDDSFFTMIQTGIIKHLQNNRIISRGYHKVYHQSIPAKLERCVKHRIKKYIWAKQSLTVNESGQSSNPVPEPELPGIPDERTRIMNEFSLEILFNMQSLSNLLLRNISSNLAFSPEILMSPPAQIFKEPIDFQMIHELFQQVLVIFASEPQVLQLSVPTTIIGSLSGSIFDLLQFERAFFPAQYHVTSSLLFLGNYTSQLFEYPLETLVYLFALKCQLPNHVFLLRGVNEMKTNNFLMTQLVTQYGTNRSTILFQQLFQIFEFLPYAAIINDKIFAVHSGIPVLKRPLLDLLRSTTTTAASKDEVLSQMIYNVPAQFTPKDSKGVGSNNAMMGFQTRAEKDVPGYFYNHRATFRFLKQNGFERIIRSCNPCRDGFATMFQNGVITVSSSSLRSQEFTAQHVGVIKLDSSKFKHKILIMRLEALSQKAAPAQPS